MKKEEERRARLENDAATNSLAVETDKERKARLEKMVVTTQFRLALGDMIKILLNIIILIKFIAVMVNSTCKEFGPPS